MQSIRRKPEEDRYDSALLKSITGIPCNPQATREEPAIASPREPVIASPSAKGLVQPPAIDDKKRKLKRLYITKKDLEKFGYTADCPACDATQIGKRTSGIQHTNRCRDRLEEHIRGEEEENPRVARHESRVGEAVTGMPKPVSGKRPQNPSWIRKQETIGSSRFMSSVRTTRRRRSLFPNHNARRT